MIINIKTLKQIFPGGHILQLRYLATITVDNVQYKTYPQTYSTKEEAEEALSDTVIKKLG